MLQHFLVEHREGCIVYREHQSRLVRADVLLDLLDGLEYVLLCGNPRVEKIAFRGHVGEAALSQRIHGRLKLRLATGIRLVIARDQEDIRRPGGRCGCQ